MSDIRINLTEGRGSSYPFRLTGNVVTVAQTPVGGYLLSTAEVQDLRDQANAVLDGVAPPAPIVSNGPNMPVTVNSAILYALCMAENDDDYAAAFDYLRERGVEFK